MGYKAAVQVLKKAEDLKLKVTKKCDLLNDSEAWTHQQQLQTIYHQVLVLDLEYALDKKVEQELWTLGFKNHITVLQEQARDRKNPHRSESQALLSWCLEAASGFYLTLLQELCTTFGLDLQFRRKGSVYGQLKDTTYTEQISLPQSSSCLYICQYCLVHLGDIARYRNQRRQAESFYRQAILVSPTSGHPYNQLALLEASQGNKLSTVFHYVRGIAVKNPFPASITNLINTFSTVIEKESPIAICNSKMTAAEYIQLFLCVQGMLHMATELQQAEKGVKNMNSTLTALVATQSFTTEKLIEITVVNLYALWHTVGNGKLEDLIDDEMKVRELILDLLAGSVCAFLMPVHTLKADETLLEYYALPAVKFLLSWIQNEPDFLKEKVFTSRLQIWPSLCKLLNTLQRLLKDFDYTPYEKIPLPEDRDMQGFLPLTKSFTNLDFKAEEIEDEKLRQFIRAKRLIDFGTWISNHEVNGSKLIVVKENSEKVVQYEPACIQPDPTENLLEEMKSFNVVDAVKSSNSKSPEKRGGILKPQGSLEKSREEKEQVLLSTGENNDTSVGGLSIATSSGGKDLVKQRRVRQNVALQSIFKKIEENKQVKFKVEAADEQESIKFDAKSLPKSTVNNSHLVNQFRTQTFSQNHPTFAQTELPKDLVTSNVQNKTMVPYDKNPNLLYQNPDLSSMMNTQKNLPYSMPNQPQRFESQQNVNQARSYQQNSIGMHPRPGLPYQNMQYPPYSAWKPEERPTPATSAPWWPNVNQSFPQQDNNYQMNMQYSGNMQQYMPTATGFPNTDYGNKVSNAQNADMYSLWNGHRSGGVGQGNVGFDVPNQGLSMRQVMLKETTSMPGMGGFNQGANRGNGVQQDMPMMPNAASYSLFNTNSWNPSLPGQLKNSRSPHESLGGNMRHNSLFTGQAPQSLAQLLEQQNQWQKNDP